MPGSARASRVGFSALAKTVFASAPEKFAIARRDRQHARARALPCGN
jgi:hypothetical protein